MQVQQCSFTGTLIEKRYAHLYSGEARPFARVSRSSQRDSVRFGNQSAQDTFQKPAFWLLSDEQPVFLLHGTSHRGDVMEPWFRFLRQEAGLQNLIYISCLPEIEKATGIEKPVKPTTIPAYLALLRDLAEFRTQLIGQRITELRTLTQCTDDDIARKFGVRPQDAFWLVPIIREYILKPIICVPKNWHPAYEQSLRILVRKGIAQIQHESKKLKNRPENSANGIIDSEFLYKQAQAEGKLPVSKKSKQTLPETVNPRPLDLQSLNFIEGYLLAMQQELTQALQKKNRFFTTEKDRIKAEKTAQQLMDVIAPRVLLVGHSQGGTVILTALLNALQESSNFTEMAHQNPADFSLLPVQGIKSALLFSSPLNGIPEFPGWGGALSQYLEKVADYIPVLKEEQLTDMAKNLVWAAKSADKPAVLEMKAGSTLMQKLSEQLNSLTKWRGTVVSAFDQKDGYVEPTVSCLVDSNGCQPVNFFNLELQNEMLPPASIKPEDALNFISKQIPVAGSVLRKLAPYSWQEFMRDFYVKDMVGDGSKPSLEQHRALLVLPRSVSQQLDQQLLENEQNVLRMLDTRNDESFRKAALKKILFCLQDAEQPAQALVRESLRKPDSPLRAAIVQNAEEDLPLTNSVSSIAQSVLAEIA